VQVRRTPTRRSCPPYTIKNIKGAKIGFIGMTLGHAHDRHRIRDRRPRVHRRGRHRERARPGRCKPRGSTPSSSSSTRAGYRDSRRGSARTARPYKVNPTYDAACQNGSELAPDSPIIPIAKNLSPAIDMIVSGHTHQPYICDIPDPADSSGW
jgi:5'-nucleotidase